MLRHLLFTLAIGLGCFGFAARAGGLPLPGIYEIGSGTYISCCGLLGATETSLPDERQRFIELGYAGDTASIAFLGEDMQTVFSVFSCSIGAEIEFSFDHGLVLTDHIVFHVDPGPGGLYWNYDVTNSARGLEVNGNVGTGQGNCADAPTQFTHKNVVATRLTGPVMHLTEISAEGPLLMVQGRAGWQDVIEASSDLIHWTPISTNIMPYTKCAMCPFVLFRDTTTPRPPARFYRSFEIPGGSGQ
jgi:hypothetical protein